ncbi:Pentapeptide_repeats-containing protein [Hexamita inflata]|uniref:Pentapeptide repeats-containing protein n=1 Tax=Hexamita inflata TaxID=28002 RepID=A0AA86VUF4_9EUKA|nr:Pentapeptide repeats-containing protein [Hexamita inflata]
MGCASSIDASDPKPDIKQKTTQLHEVQDGKDDKKILGLISQLSGAVGSGDLKAQRSAVVDMKNNALAYAQACGNPVQIFGKLMDLLTSSDVQGMSSSFKKDIAHVAQLFSHQVYMRNKDGTAVASATQQGWKDQIKAVRNLVNASQLEATELEFEMDCIEAGIKVLGMGQLDAKNAVIDYATQVGNGLKAAASKDFGQLKQLGKDLICKLGEFGVNKLGEAWFLAVMANYYTQFLLKESPDQIDSIVDQLSKPKAEWHVLYAGLDVLEFYLEGAPAQTEAAVQALKQLSAYQQGANAWKIRDKVAQVCIRNGAAKTPNDQLPGIYLHMIIGETNAKVRKTLENADYIQKQKKKLQESWEQSQQAEEAQIDQCGEKLTAIQKSLEAKAKDHITPEDQELYEEAVQEAKDRVQQIQKMQALIDVKCGALDRLQSNVDQQAGRLAEIQNRLNAVEKAACGRSVKELTQALYDFYAKESQEWKARLGMYIPEKGVADLKFVKDISVATDVDAELHKFFDDGEKKVALIQGGAGTGKTIYCQYLITQLLQTQQIPPLYINLPQLQNWQTQMVEETLAELRFSEVEVQKLRDSQKQLLFIVDGYDEIRSYKNLYASNGLLNWNCKVLFTCRSSHLANDNQYYKYFVPPKTEKQQVFQEVVLVHFDDQQINDYLERFVAKLEKGSKSWKDWKEYRGHIDTIPGLRNLVENPFILSMIVNVLPAIVAKRGASQNQEQLIALDLYEEFVKQWFEREEERMFSNNVATDIANLKTEYEEYALSLATKMVDAGKTVVEYNSTDKQSAWKTFFDPNSVKATTIRRGVPLNASTRFYSFIHKSILEFFVSREGKRQVQKIATKLDDAVLNCSMNKQLIVDKGVFNFYKETIQRYPEFKAQLYQIIELSKTDARVAVAAANAITILNVADESFRDKDFRNVKIPGANLSLAMMDSVDFRGADLTDVNFQSAWLKYAKFDGADMKNVEFGQRAQIETGTDIRCIKLSKNGELVACACGNYKIATQPSVQIYNTKSRELVKSFEDHVNDVKWLSFNPDNSKLVSCSDDYTIIIYDLVKMQLESTITLDDKVKSVEYSNDGSMITCCSGNNVHLYSSRSNKLIKTFEGHTDSVNTVVFSQDDKYVLSGGDDKVVKVWDVQEQNLFKTIDVHTNSIHQIVFNKNYSCFGTASDDKTIKLWNAQTYELINTFKGHNSGVCSLQFSSNGEQIASGSQDGKVKLWNVESGDMLKTIDAHTRQVIGVQISNDGLTIISGSGDRQIKFWNTKSSPLIKSIDGHSDEIQNAIFSHNYQFIVSCSQDKTVKLWNPDDGKLIKTLSVEHTESIWDIALNQDDTLLLTASADCTVKLWDIASGKCIKTVQLNGDGWSVAFHNDGNQFALACNDGSVQVWNIQGNEPEQTILYNNEDSEPVRCVKYCKDGELLAFGGDDTNVYVCDPKTGEIIHIYKGLTNAVYYLAFSSDQKLAAKDSLGYVKSWDINEILQGEYGEEEEEEEKEEEFDEDAVYLFNCYDQEEAMILVPYESCLQFVEPVEWKMKWVSGQYTLQMDYCSIIGTRNLSDENLQLLRQYDIKEKKIKHKVKKAKSQQNVQ